MSLPVAPAIRALLDREPAARALGPYRLIEPLGAGGFAPVWLASERFGEVEIRTVAIKLFALAAGAAGDDVVRELQALGRVEHPNVVRFYACVREGDVLGLVMEHVRGIELERHLDEVDRLTWGEVVALGIAIASALEAIHGAGLVHRDVKPANVVAADGVYKLIDFGIASIEARPGSEGSGPGRAPPSSSPSPRTVVVDALPLETSATKAALLEGPAPSGADRLSGTIGYVDPKCLAEMAPATPASDLYALGATLFRAAAGALPAVVAARAAGVTGLKGEVLDGRAPAPPLADAAPGCPPRLAAIVDRLLSVDPLQRPASAAEVRLALEALTKDRGQELPSVALDPAELLALRPRVSPLAVLAVIAGLAGMGVSFVFLASRVLEDVIAGAAGFVAASVLAGAGVLSAWRKRA